MKKMMIRMVILLLCFSLIGCNKNDKELIDNQKNWILDLDGPIRDAFSTCAGINENMTDEERNQRIDSIIDNIEKRSWTDEQIKYALKELISDFQIAHMGIYFGDEFSESTKIYPITGMWFGNQYRIVGSLPEYQQYFGGVIKEVNGITIDEILKRYDTIISNETESWLMYVFESIVKQQGGFNSNDLKYLNIIEDEEEDLEIVIELDGKDQSVFIKPIDFDSEEFDSYCSIYSSMNNLPMYEKINSQSNGAPFAYELDKVNHAFYFQYNQCVDETIAGADSGYPNFEEFFDDMIENMKSNSNEYDVFIIDLRQNGGGSSVLMEEAVKKHDDFLSSQKIHLLIGKATFSAAVDAIDTLLIQDYDVTIYGEETGLAIHNYTDVIGVELPSTGHVLGIVDHKDWCGAIDKRATDLSKGVLPDIEVMQDYENYINGIDYVYIKATQ